jgi:hypothetical protein
MIRREKMKDTKRTGAKMVREMRDSLVSPYGVEGRGEDGGEAALVVILRFC